MPQFYIRFPVLLPQAVARGVLPPRLLLAPGGPQRHHHGEGPVCGELRGSLRDGGGGPGTEVLEVHDHLQEAPQRVAVQRK